MVVLQSRLDFAPWAEPRHRRLPGIQTLAPEDWLVVDDAHAGQMALRDRMIAENPGRVHALRPEGAAAARELYAHVLGLLGRDPRYRVDRSSVMRPDGVAVALEPGQPLLTLGRLIQADLCLMQAQGDEHVLTGAILCFPAGWTLEEKIGRPLTRIHGPVAEYDADLAARVQRLFHGIRPGRPLWRANVLLYATPDLHAPHREAAPRPPPAGRADYIRSEKQCLLRLPRTRAVVFSIHTAVVHRSALTPDQARAFAALHAGPPPAA